MNKFAKARTTMIALLLGALPAQATVKAELSRLGNFTFPQGASVLVPLNAGGVTELTFSGSGKHMITYTAECTVGAASGNTTTWLDIDVELIADVAVGTVQVLSPTTGTADAFCTSDGTAGSDGWTRVSISVATPALLAVTHKVRIRATIQNGAAGTSGWLGDAAILVTK